MKIVTSQDLACTAAKRWKKQYYKSDGWFQTASGDSEDVYTALKDLSSPTPRLVEEVIGNDSWTKIDCGECGRYVSTAIQLGDPEFQETILICKTCLNKSVRLLEKL